MAAGSRLLSWAAVTALVWRRMGPASLAMLALVRTTVGLLNYTAVGLAPATVRLLAVESAAGGETASVVYSSAAALAGLAALAAAALAGLYAIFFNFLHVLPASMANLDLRPFALAMALGMAARSSSDPFGAALQVRGRMAWDNLLLAGAEWLWLILCLSFVKPRVGDLLPIGAAWLASGVILAAARVGCAEKTMGRGSFSISAVRGAAVKSLLAFGVLVAVAQAADFLYAPVDNLLINRLISPLAVAVYAPAIQIDAGLLLLAGALAAALLPHSAMAHAGGRGRQVMRYYLWGTLLSTALLAAAALAAWLAAPWLFAAWLHDPLPATQIILPLVLIHTVVGGSSAVGRAVLLAIGKVKPFTLAVLIAGAANVLLSFIFVRYCGWGLKGIILGTIVAVIGRCAIWTPWYVIRTLRRPQPAPASAA